MYGAIRLCRIRREGLLKICSIELPLSPTALTSRQHQRWRNSWRLTLANQTRGAKTVSKRKLKDLDQGIISGAPLPAEDVPQTLSVIDGVKNNMIKFDKCVLLTRVGKFYELYFEHADEYGPLLGLKVANRRSTLGPVSMAGFPVWQLDRFLKILVQDHNKYVAISEEIPVSSVGKVKTGAPMYDRRVTRVVTPGTLIDEKFLDPYQNNYLLSIEAEASETSQDKTASALEQKFGLAWLDLSTGDFSTQTTTMSLLPSILMRIGAREILLPLDATDKMQDDIKFITGQSHDLITLHENSSEFTTMSKWNSMLASPIQNVAESHFSLSEKLAGHRLLDYVQTRLQDLAFQLQPPRRREAMETLVIDRSSLRGLEILETSREGFGKGSLFHAIRRTVTKSGARLLRDRITAPSASLNEINDRLDLVTIFCSSETLREGLVHHLRQTFDVQRLVQKFSLNKGDADDMLCLARSISESCQACEVLETYLDQESKGETMSDETPGSKSPLRLLLERFSHEGPIDLSTRILHAIDEEGLNQAHRLEEDEAAGVASFVQEVVMETAPEELECLPKAVRSKSKPKDQDIEVEDPWIMRRNASDTIDRLHENLDSLKTEKLELAQRLRNELSASTLTLRWTPGLGHICHVKSANKFDRSLLDSMNARVVSSSKSTISFYLTDWSRLGARIDTARDNIRKEEQRIFVDLRQLVIKNLVHLRRNAAIMDELDVATSLALLVQEQGWTRPIINTSTAHKIVGGRHPTVKLGLEEQGRSFVSNDLFLGDKERAWIVTGPNMAGKSTFLRQNALITILAQVGSYVPAEHAEIGLVDQIFSRIGAADDLFRDQSTFMVEMLETAAILKHATPRSFVIMDEVGRGTTPEDGTAVAFASLHHLYHTNMCRTLFATHFHALVDMTEAWSYLGRYHTDVLEDGSGSFSFIHKLKRGVNRQSHALKVAKMAGMPDSALEIAKTVLDDMNAKKLSSLDSAHVPGNDRAETAAAATN